MEFNGISMLMDVKLDIYDKRPDSLKFKTWTRCHVKIEAIKCLPCFLRITFQSVPQDNNEESMQLSISVNVPGVAISLANSRYKQFSYGLFWTHNRRDCFVYFGLDTEMSCRKHMKWMKKSIKNLELYRQVFLEERRNSRGPGLFYYQENKRPNRKELSAVKDALSALGPLPQIPDINNRIDWFPRVSRSSEIYEEIYEGTDPTSRLSRRLSRTSDASGIYEEMKPYSANIHPISEEKINSPPPLPPHPSQRKRLNTFESDPLSLWGDIPRSNTNPESELAKKTKYLNVVDNVLVGGRSKRSESVSETAACTFDDIINSGENNKQPFQPIYANDMLKQPLKCARHSKRNSFSSPDLSKINFLDSFDEDKLAVLNQLNNSSGSDDAHIDDDFDCDDLVAAHNYSSLSLNESSLDPNSSVCIKTRNHAFRSKYCSMESFNLSAKLPQNFNFSACNTSSINLMGASGAVPSIKKFNNIVVEDELTGYCVMAPILSKLQDGQGLTATTTSSTTSSTTSGYSSGSYSSSTTPSSSSNTQVTDNKEQTYDNVTLKNVTKNTVIESFYDELPSRKTPLSLAEGEKNNFYENIQNYTPLNGSKASATDSETTPTFNKDFTGNLYENLLTIKAAQELEQPLSARVCTSTPTESPAENPALNHVQQQQNIYQTPRKSIISVDDKIPSYYPNSCETVIMRRKSNSPVKQTTPGLLKTFEKGKASIGLKTFVNIKLKGELKENLFISSPQKLTGQRQKSCNNTGGSHTTKASKTKRSSNAQKISDNVYTVNLANKKSLQFKNNNNDIKKSTNKEVNETGQFKEKPHDEFLQLAFLQNLDFKFDDTSNLTRTTNIETRCASTTSTNSHVSVTPSPSGIAKLEQAELEYENCYQATKDATRLLHKYATLTPNQSLRIQRQLQQHLPLKEDFNQKLLMTQSTKLEVPVTNSDMSGASSNTGSKKFASLPRFKKIDFSPLKQKINNVLQRNQDQDF